MRPRVWFGERWVNSVFDLFEENVRYFPALLPITDDEDPLAVLEAGGTPTLGGAAAPQRHDLPLEPAGLRHRRGSAPPAGGEPGPRRRADRRRHGGQRGVLLRPGPRARRERAPAVVADVVQRRRGELPRRRAAGHRRPGLLAGRRPGPGDRAGAAPAAAAGPRGPGRLGRRAGGRRPAARDHRAALPDRRSTARSGSSQRMAPARRPGPLRRAPRARSWTTASGCTPTSRSTPGTEPGSPQPHPGPAARRCAGPASRGG